MFEMVPFRKNRDLQKRGDYFDQLLDNFFDDSFFPSTFTGGNFKVDVKENENSYLVEADLPGINKENISIDYDNNYLIISAKRETNIEEKNQNYVRRERTSGELRRSFYIDNIDETKIDASFTDGVLKIVLPKENKVIENKRRIDIH